jgi:hypothetical protein
MEKVMTTKKYSYKPKTKVIEIEGKGTPEIHTDKNFNIKNLGTTPHSKGGNKVVAKEGDVVFPTQNSKYKYKKIMTAIKTGDKETLEKERKKLPEDNNPKKGYGDGYITGRGKPSGMPDDYYNNDSNSSKIVNGPQADMSIAPYEEDYTPDPWNSFGSKEGDPWEYQKNNLTGEYRTRKNGGNWVTPKGKSYTAINDLYNKSTEPVANANSDLPNTTGTAPTQDATGVLAPPPADNSMDGNIFGKPTAAEEASRLGVPTSTTSNNSTIADLGKNANPGGSNNTLTSTSEGGLGNALTYAPAIYNTLAGVFEPQEYTKRRFYNPETRKYEDMSDPLRQASIKATKVDQAAIKNITGGNPGAMLSNLQQASNRQFDRDNSIESNEVGRKIDTQNYNRDLKNQAQMANLQLANQYDDLDLQNESAKRSFLTTGLSQGSQISQMDKYQKNLANADNIRAQSFFSPDFQFDPVSGGIKYKYTAKKIEKGVKSVKTKYKYKK